MAATSRRAFFRKTATNAAVAGFIAASGGGVRANPLGFPTGHDVNVMDYGATGLGIADDTAAFAAAIAAVPATGGTVYVPPGMYAINLTINRPKIRLVGSHVGRISSVFNPSGLVPYDNTQPVLQLSNDTQLNEGIQLENLEFNGRVAGHYGLKMNGGTYTGFFNNLSFGGFLKKGLWIESGAARPIAYLYFDGLVIQPPTVAVTSHEHNILIKSSARPQYCTAVFFTNVRLSGLAAGWNLELASVQASFANSWFHTDNGHGVLLSETIGGQIPHLTGHGLYLDSDGDSDTLVTVSRGGGTKDLIENYIQGLVGIDGLVDLNGTPRRNEAVQHIPYRTKMVYPTTLGSHYFSDASDPNILTMRVNGTAATGAIGITSDTGRIALTCVNHLYMAVDGVTRIDVQADRLRPNLDDGLYCGDTTHRWKSISAVNGTINTSDERDKQDIAAIDDAVLDAWATVDFVQYRWKDAVAKEGDDARIHHGVIAQRVVEAFAAHGLDARRYGLLCHDDWEAHDELAGQDPDPEDPSRMVDRVRRVPAGDRYGVRYTECLGLEAALQRRTTARLQARLDAMLARSQC